MSPEHTHYKYLKVSSDAPVEVVRAAYRVLAQRHHPDRNLGNPASVEIMAILNEAYRVLSDPGRRRQYDLWLLTVGAVSNATDTFAGARTSNCAPNTSQRRNYDEENPTAPHSQSVPASRTVDLDQMWERWFGPQIIKASPAGKAANSYSEHVFVTRTVDLDSAWDEFLSVFKSTTSKTRNG